MALPSKYGIDKKINSMEGLSAYENGGKGSGNFGHSGRPGEVGGSGSGKGGGESSKESTKLQKRILDLEDRISQVEKDFEGNKRTKIDMLHTKRALMEELSQARLEWAVAKRKEGEVKEKLDREKKLGTKVSKAIAGSKKNIDQAKIVQKDIEDRIGQKVKKGEEYSALDEASTSRFKYFHGEDGTEYTYDKGNGMITKTNPKTGDQEVVTKQKKDYGSERSGVNVRDGHQIASEFADLSAELETARTNLKMLKEDKGKAYKDLAGRNRYMDRSSEISRSLHYAEALRKSKLSKETKKLVKEMESELKSIRDEYDKLGTEKYFDPDLNHEN